RRDPAQPLSPLAVLPPVGALLLADVSPDALDGPDGPGGPGGPRGPGSVLADRFPDGYAASHGLREPTPPDDSVLTALPPGTATHGDETPASPLPLDGAEERPAPSGPHDHR